MYTINLIREAFVDESGRPLSHVMPTRRRRKKEVRVSYAEGSYVVLETYGVGSMLGFEQLLGEEAMLSFGAPRDSAVRASSNGCNAFALKITAMMDLNRCFRKA